MNKESIIFQPAFLWDGQKRLAGNLELGPKDLTFHFENFKNSNLELQIPLEKIATVDFYKLYGLEVKGLEIIDDEGRKNIFILHDPKKLKQHLNPNKTTVTD